MHFWTHSSFKKLGGTHASASDQFCLNSNWKISHSGERNIHIVFQAGWWIAQLKNSIFSLSLCLPCEIMKWGWSGQLRELLFINCFNSNEKETWVTKVTFVRLSSAGVLSSPFFGAVLWNLFRSGACRRNPLLVCSSLEHWSVQWL